MAGKHVQKSGGTQSRAASVVEERRGARRRRYEDNIYDYGGGREKEPGGARLRWAIPVIAALLAVVAYLAFTMVSAKRVASLDTIYPNVTVAGVNLGGMTVDEAVSALEASPAAPD